MPDYELRAVRPDEYGDTLRLWNDVFGDGDSYFRAYLEGDPWHQDRYCQVAVADGRIVSAVHVCKRPIRFESGISTMGGIANVATHPDHRRHGLSGKLLDRCVQIMKEDGFDFSTLGTGNHRHYERHGWNKTQVSRFDFELDPNCEMTPDAEVRPLSIDDWLSEAPSAYAQFNAGFPLHFERSPEYWSGWLKIRSEGWDSRRGVSLGIRDGGRLAAYLLGELPDEPGGVTEIKEAAGDLESLDRLFRETFRLGHDAGSRRFSIGIPRIAALHDRLTQIGEIEKRIEGGMMFQAFSLDDETVREFLRRYEIGEIDWWDADGF